jgi:N-acetylglutamate synthase-like GNAT family acetyltransferase
MPRIRAYSPGDAAGVLDLVLMIQRAEFGMTITTADQPDLIDVPAFYFRGAGHFWVALAKGEVIGTIGLLDIGNRQGAIRKMFVASQWRGREHKVAARLLERLLGWASDHGLTDIYLGTTEWFQAAQRFYVRNGFREIRREELPLTFPVMAVDTRFFHRPL